MLQWANLLQKVLFLCKCKGSFRFRRWWVKTHLREEMREIFGAYNSLFLVFIVVDHEEFYNMTRMTPIDFEALHSLVGPRLKKHSLRKPLLTRLRLSVTLK